MASGYIGSKRYKAIDIAFPAIFSGYARKSPRHPSREEMAHPSAYNTTLPCDPLSSSSTYSNRPSVVCGALRRSFPCRFCRRLHLHDGIFSEANLNGIRDEFCEGIMMEQRHHCVLFMLGVGDGSEAWHVGIDGSLLDALVSSVPCSIKDCPDFR